MVELSTFTNSLESSWGGGTKTSEDHVVVAGKVTLAQRNRIGKKKIIPLVPLVMALPSIGKWGIIEDIKEERIILELTSLTLKDSLTLIYS